MNLAGSASCIDGILRAKLAGGRDENAKVRVLGGSFVVFMDHEPMSQVYGVWEVRAQREEAEDPVNGRSLYHACVELPLRCKEDVWSRDLVGSSYCLE